jgi:K+-transporting ATPase ATPase C chain
MWQQLIPGLRMMVVLTVLTGLIYPGVVTAICKLVFAEKANGSLAVVNGRPAGSYLIGQNFKRPEYFHPRPSAAGNDGYDATSSLASNYGATNQKLIDRVKVSVANFRNENRGYKGPIPADAVTASASGLDPEISPANAEAQTERVAHARGVSVEQVRSLITQNTAGRDLGLLGEPRVNVLKLNMALDRTLR